MTNQLPNILTSHKRETAFHLEIKAMYRDVQTFCGLTHLNKLTNPKHIDKLYREKLRIVEKHLSILKNSDLDTIKNVYGYYDISRLFFLSIRALNKNDHVTIQPSYTRNELKHYWNAFYKRYETYGTSFDIQQSYTQNIDEPISNTYDMDMHTFYHNGLFLKRRIEEFNNDTLK